jgi:hypothetical protein
MTGFPRHEHPEPEEKDTSVPGLRSWGAVYWLAAGSLVLWIVLLTLFMRRYS